ncbi:DUF1667 domain-containing protein [Alkalibaculum sp. M08DMB]|uniref:DUF1667 domain-containing protein n=1 Tax=Alkalibaculum sporogenes TaxID=2655001 RepID=A0A6A7K926_9FIRM|nr:DUF1667 domain-containing protein [Alkalibaculum sporogenes]MPW25892.1 DUF1667 domain-containing protein [Alkalibaculum sporogenes]
MVREKSLICVVCPKGCKISIIKKDGDHIIKGNACSRGEVYAIDEYTAPKRIITTTIKVENSPQSVTSVKTTSGVPKDDIFAIMNIINKTTIKSPCTVGDIVLKNIGNSGADLIVTRNSTSQ